MMVVLLGAGASRAALGEQAPTSREFGRIFVQSDPSWPDRLPFLAGALRYLAAQDRHIAEDDWALDRVWNGIDENHKLAAFIANSDFQWPATVPGGRIYSVYRLRTWGAFWVLAGYEMRRAVNEIYGLRLESAIRLYLEAPGQLSTLLRALEPGDVVASMNYDLLADRILQAKWPGASNCRSEEDARTRTDQHGSLILKLHGSLDWDFMSHPEEGAWVERTPDRKPISDRAIDYDAQGWEHRPLIVAPVRFKDDVLIPGIQPRVLVETLAFPPVST